MSVGSPLEGDAWLCYLCWSRASARLLCPSLAPQESFPWPLPMLSGRAGVSRVCTSRSTSPTSSTSSAARSSGSPTPRGWPARDDRRHLADRGLHRQPRRPVRRVRLRRAGRPDRRVPREGPDLRAPADGHGRVHQPRDRRDPRAVGVHGRLPVDDRARHLHHQRHRARRRDPARALAGRLPDGAQGPREAGLRRQPDAGPRLLARARDRQEGQGLRPHRPQAQAPGHRAAARDGLRLRRADPRPVRELALHPQHGRVRHRADALRGGRAGRALQEAASGRAAERRERARAAQPALLRPQALRPRRASAATS